MPAIWKSSSLRELYVGDNPWNEQEWKSMVNVYVKPSNLNVLSLGAHTYLSEECVSVIILPQENEIALATFWLTVSISANKKSDTS